MTTPSKQRVPLPDTEREAPQNATNTGKTSPQQLISVSVIVRVPLCSLERSTRGAGCIHGAGRCPSRVDRTCVVND